MRQPKSLLHLPIVWLFTGIALCCEEPGYNSGLPIGKRADTVLGTNVSTRPAVIPEVDATLWRARWIDSLKRNVARGYGTSGTRAGVQRNNAYLYACWMLGDYYAQQYIRGKEQNMKPAQRYFDKFICLTEGTDSDLGDNNSMYTRNRLCKRVAQYYDDGLIDLMTLRSPYVGHYIHPRRANLHNRFSASLFDTGAIQLRFPPGNSGISPDTRRALRQLAQVILSDPDRRVLVDGGACRRELEQQISWEQANAVIEYLGRYHGLSRDRFMMSYCGNEAPAGSVSIRWARPGETGPSDTPPPHPGLLDGW